MRTTTLLAALSALTLSACHDHDDGVSRSDWYITYPNGHPLAIEDYSTSEELEVTDLINDHRVAAGLDALSGHGTMKDVALAHSVHMDLHSFLGKTNPEGDTEADRADIAGFFWLRYGEILAAGSSDPYEIFDSWLATPAHDTIDDPLWTHIAVAHDGGYWTADFMTR